MTGIKITRWRNGGDAIFIDGGVHAREWASTVTVMYLIDRLISDYGKDKNITILADYFDWYILPMFNPDGYEYSWKNIETRLWRKNRSNHTDSQKCIGTDLNRNFDYEWNKVGTDSDPCGMMYPGPKPVSEIETRNVAEYLLNLGEEYVDAYFTYHSIGQVCN